jgi:hypothetical protein
MGLHEIWKWKRTMADEIDIANDNAARMLAGSIEAARGDAGPCPAAPCASAARRTKSTSRSGNDP